MKMYSIYDKKASKYDYPFPSENHETAIRSLRASFKSGQSMLERFPSDYALVYVGEFDMDKGDVNNVDNFILAEVAELVGNQGQAGNSERVEEKK